MIDGNGFRTWIGGLGALGFAIVLVVTSGLPGAALGVAVVLTWVIVGDLTAYALAIVSVGVALETASITTVTPTAIAIPLTLMALLIGPATRTDRPVAMPVLVLLLTMGVGTLAMLPLLSGGSIAQSGAVLAVVVAAISYGLHRYGVVASGVLQHG